MASVMADVTGNVTSYAGFSEEEYWANYDHRGAILFIMGLVVLYGGAILFLLLSMMHRSRAELEISDHLRDLDEIREKARQTGSYRWKVVHRDVIRKLSQIRRLSKKKRSDRKYGNCPVEQRLSMKSAPAADKTKLGDDETDIFQV